ncbi:hypothetical protein LVD13_11900 [Flavobacteriaceae bacterium D16]|nr:hypothetical protein [Flavobacteriaceae bacterium D16]
MPHILKNNSLEVQLDLPLEGYSFSRFDWTGKVTRVLYRDVPATTIERTDSVDTNLFGMGLYNEFGIETAIGFEETQQGEWFHKIGVGALQKSGDSYQFTVPYKIRPANFQVEPYRNKLRITCVSETLNGYAYRLIKEFSIEDSSLTITYQLENTGQKAIVTEEYVHNFMGADQDLIGKQYELRFSFPIEQEKFQMLVNPEGKMILGSKEITFNGTPEEQFFISHLNGTKTIPAFWELKHKKSKIGIRETGSFETQKVNLWGWQHVVSPELFHTISVAPGKKQKWTRTYEFFNL